MEKDIQKKILKYLEGLGYYTLKIIIGNRNGIPDIICCIDGQFIGIEVKSVGKNPTPLQLLNLKSIETSGGYTVVADDFEEFKKVIGQIINKIKEGRK